MNDHERSMRDLFERHLGGLHPTVPVEAMRRRARRSRIVIAISGATALALIAVAVVMFAGSFQPERRDRVVGPAPSPDKGLIAFTSQRRNEQMPWVAIVPATGGEVTRLHEGMDPSWSPDGTRIAFTCRPGICTTRADGSELRRLTNPKEPAFDEAPDWGPNGWIAFTRNYMDHPGLATARARDILLVAPDGSERVTITTHASDDLSPSWSPDGRSIAYIRAEGGPSEAPPGGWHLWAMDADGGGAEMLAQIDGPARPDWSPDGQAILFDRGSALWTIRADGGEPRKLPVVSGRGFDVGSSAGWAPDSRRFAFTCSSTGTDNNDICLADVDSEEWTALVATNQSEAAPAWQPDPQAAVSDEQTHGNDRHRRRLAKEVERLNAVLQRLLLERTRTGRGLRSARGEGSSRNAAQIEAQIAELESLLRNMKSQLEKMSTRE